MEGIRDRLYGFVMYSPKHEKGDQAGEPKTNMALDISFGSSGYALVLARAFKKVCTKKTITHVNLGQVHKINTEVFASILLFMSC